MFQALSLTLSLPLTLSLTHSLSLSLLFSPYLLHSIFDSPTLQITGPFHKEAVMSTDLITNILLEAGQSM